MSVIIDSKGYIDVILKINLYFPGSLSFMSPIGLNISSLTISGLEPGQTRGVPP